MSVTPSTRGTPDVSSTTMLAATVVEPGRVEVQRVALPQPAERQVRVRLEGCGVCASNIPPFDGRPWFSYPFAPGALGHEGWGTVDAVGPAVTGLREGERVAFISDHAYAQYDCVDAHAAVKLPPALDSRPFPGEPLGCAVNIHHRAEIRQGQAVAIVGVGFVGSLLTQLARHAGAKVIAVSRRRFALDIAKRMGADHTVCMDEHERVIQQVRNITEGRLCDVVIECVGKQWPLDLAAELTRVRGRFVVAGFHQDGPRQINLQLWNWRGLDVINAHERDPAVYTRGIQEAVQAVTSGRLDPNPLYTHRYGLGQLGAALEATRDRPDRFMKALIDMDL